MCGGAAAERYEVTVKDAKLGVECKAAGLVLVPMVVEVFGRWGERSVEAMKLATKVCTPGARRASVFRLLGLTCAGACWSRFSA